MSLAFDPFHSPEEVLLEKALGIDDDDNDADDGANPDDQDPPADGFEHLKRAMREARKLEEVKIASNADKIMDKAKRNIIHYVSREKASLEARFVPSQKWQEGQIRRFSDLRLRLERHQAWMAKSAEEGGGEGGGDGGKRPKFPQREDEKGWCLFCHGPDLWPRVLEARLAKAASNESSESELEEEQAGDAAGKKSARAKKPDFVPERPDGTPPLASVLGHLRANVVNRIFEMHVDWIEAMDAVPEEVGPWLYALMSRLEKPLYPDIGSALRTLALVCSRQRERVIKEGKELAVVNSLTLFICLVAKYFNQADLAD